MGLFRQEAIDAQRHRLQGHVVLLPRWPHALLSALLLLWLAALITFLTQASYSRKETVRGWLEPADGMVRIFPQAEGRIAQLLVAEGEPVVKGQPVAIINGDRILEDGAHLEALLLEEYQARKDAMERQLAREAVLEELRNGELLARIGDAKATLKQLDEQAATLAQRIAIGEQRLARHRSLAEAGHLTASELEQLEEQQLLLTSERQELTVQRLQQASLLKQLRAERQRLPEETRNAEDRLRIALGELSAEIAQLRGNRAHVLVAPLDGQVSSIGFAEGQRATYEQALMTLLPENSPLEATLLVPVRAAGFLETGQALHIRYDAFPYQKFGLQAGEIVEVTAGTVLPSDQANLPLRISEPVFRVTAVPADDGVPAYGRRFELKPGMTLSADIVLEERSLLQWLLEPLHSLRGRMT